MEGLNQLLGLGVEPKHLAFYQMVLRAVIVFLAALVMVRISDRRFLSRLSPFDAILGFLLASMLSRAINGSAPFFQTLGSGAVLVLIHRVIGTLAYRSDQFGRIVKGDAKVLVKEGRIDPENLRKNKISEKDLLEEARLNGKTDTIQSIRMAILERNGKISVLPKSE